MARKRGQGEGSIYKRKDGTWSVQATVEGHRITKYFKTRSEAQEWLQTTLAEIKAGLTMAGVHATVEQFLEQWLGAVRPSVRPNTGSQYTQVVHQHINPILGKIKLKDLRPDHIQSLYDFKLKSGISERSVLLIHAVIRHALNQAMRWGLIGRNPAQAVIRPRYRKHEMQVLDDQQVRTLLLATDNTRLGALFHVAVTTGLREGELLGLKWSDLTWNTRQLKVQRQVQRQKGKGLVFTEPKSAAGRRVIILGPTTLLKLRSHHDLQQLERLAVGENWIENDLIFPSSIGTPLDFRNLLKSFKVILAMTGLPDIRFHDLRHTSATLMLLQGVHPKIVQERLGHSDISLTLNTYSHVLPGMQAEAADQLDELLTPINVTEVLKR